MRGSQARQQPPNPRQTPFPRAHTRGGQAGFDVRDYLFLKKLVRFLVALQEVEAEDRRDFQKRIEEDKGFRKRVGENVLLLLDRADDMAKPDLLGKAFLAFLSGAVTFEQFSRMAAGIDRCLLLDLKLLVDAKYNRIDEPAGANLLPSGLVVADVAQLIGGNRTSYPFTDAGKLVRRYCLE